MRCCDLPHVLSQPSGGRCPQAENPLTPEDTMSDSNENTGAVVIGGGYAGVMAANRL